MLVEADLAEFVERGSGFTLLGDGRLLGEIRVLGHFRVLRHIRIFYGCRIAGQFWLGLLFGNPQRAPEVAVAKPAALCMKERQMQNAFPRPGATDAQLRDDIDSGRTGDKVPASDPAAAPLGTDDEAAGAPHQPEVVATVRRAETAGRPKHPDSPTARGKQALLIFGALMVFLALALAIGISIGAGSV